MITSIDQLDFNKKYTYSDYVLWKFQERVELLKGKIFKMAAPSLTHQEISSNLHGLFWFHFRNHSCKLYAAPVDVRLPLPEHRVTSDKIDTVIQPDLCVVCDVSKLVDNQSCVGAPDLVVEILSPGNSRREMKDKFELYEEAGVLEYWVVDPSRRSVLVYVLKENGFISTGRPFLDDDILNSTIFEDLKVDLSEVFPKETEIQ
jgi:Uma2 family endonuclease